MKTAYLAFRPCENHQPTRENFLKVGSNTGNLVFDASLRTTIQCTPLLHEELEQRSWEFDALVVRNFIWMSENKDMSSFREIMKRFGQKPIIPISAGLQSPDFRPDFHLHPETAKILQELSERCCIGVRGEYTARILEKHGIRNLRIIGCPSLYYRPNFNRKICPAPQITKENVLSNYKTLSKTLDTPLDHGILNYLAQNTGQFVEQTPCYLPDRLRTSSFSNFMKFYQTRKLFFRFEDWLHFVSGKSFSIGGRFHGNVVPVLAGVPALFVVFDSRTRELTSFFSLPTIDAADFDPQKPLQYYYELADYSRFNRRYPILLENFIDFCLENGLELTSGMGTYFHRKLTGKGGAGHADSQAAGMLS